MHVMVEPVYGNVGGKERFDYADDAPLVFVSKLKKKKVHLIWFSPGKEKINNGSSVLTGLLFLVDFFFLVSSKENGNIKTVVLTSFMECISPYKQVFCFADRE